MVRDVKRHSLLLSEGLPAINDKNQDNIVQLICGCIVEVNIPVD
jgi:hypothetical protein